MLVWFDRVMQEVQGAPLPHSPWAAPCSLWPLVASGSCGRRYRYELVMRGERRGPMGRVSGAHAAELQLRDSATSLAGVRSALPLAAGRGPLICTLSHSPSLTPPCSLAALAGRRHKSSNARSRGMDDAFSPRDRRVPVPPPEDGEHSALGPSDADDESDDGFPQVDAAAASGRQSAFDRKLLEVMNERKTILSPSTDSKLLEMVDKMEHGALQDLGMLGDPLPGASRELALHRARGAPYPPLTRCRAIIDPVQEPRHFHIKDVARARRRRRIPITADLARSIAREGPVPILRKQVRALIHPLGWARERKEMSY